MLNIAICDDEKMFCSQIESIILENKEQLNQNALNIDIYYDGLPLYKALKNNTEYDVIFLDIEMAELDGIKLGHLIREDLKNEDTQIVYVSSKTSYALELFQNRPLNFLVKPVKDQDIINQIKTSIKIQDKNNLNFEFSYNKEHYKISYKDIMYFESDNRKIKIHTIDNTYEIYAKLSDIIKDLPALDFIEIHKSFIVNYKFIKQINYDSLILINQTPLSISRSRRKQVREILLKRKKGLH